MITQSTYIAQAGDLIEQRTGLAVGAQFRIDLEHILYDLAGGDLSQFIATLRATRESEPEWQALLRALTIGETYFFRDALPFQLLRTTILPNLIQTRRQNRREITIWCAGCATGEEVYSVAITLYEMLADIDQWTIRLFGTDLNAQAVEAARQGIYREWSFRHSSPEFQTRYFDAVPGGWQIKSFIREMATIRHANLLNGAPLSPCDVVFCRNTLLYFGRGHVEAGESALFDALMPGGWLFMGQSEAIRTQRDRWLMHVLAGSIAYQKPLLTAVQTTVTTPIHDSLPKTTYAAALHAAHHDQMAAAERALREILGEQSGDLQARLLLAYILASRNDADEAHAHVNTVLQLDPMQADAHYLRATLYLEAGDTDAADRSLRAALYCRRDHPLAAFLLGNLYYKASDPDRAVRMWENTHRVIATLQPDSWFSDFSDMTAANFANLIRSQIDSAL